MRPANTLFILSDQHSRRVLGCYGHPLVRTPNLDKLAASGVRFTDGYCTSPICVPARASLATGQYVHKIRYWDNAHPYDGSIPSWGHRLVAAGHNTVSIGKLHFRRTEDGNGFVRELIPMHVVGGVGDLLGLIRDDPPPRKSIKFIIERAGVGGSHYQDYDNAIADNACEWLMKEASRHAKPWVLMVSLVCPHHPYRVAKEYFDLYPMDRLPWPKLYAKHDRPKHPFIDAIRRHLNFDDYFTEDTVRRVIAAYFGMVTYLDHNIGRVLSALESAGLADSTRVIYTTDHGENLGARGLWDKETFYEESAGVPLIASGPGLPRGTICNTPVSHVDIFPTIVQSAGLARSPDDDDLPGTSLIDIANGHRRPGPVLCEYHAAGSVTGGFMIRHGDLKYMHYVGLRPMLFDLRQDPEEINDLAGNPAYGGTLVECEQLLRSVVDPDAATRLAFQDQAATIQRHGGREAILRQPHMLHTPAPGEPAVKL